MLYQAKRLKYFLTSRLLGLLLLYSLAFTKEGLAVLLRGDAANSLIGKISRQSFARYVYSFLPTSYAQTTEDDGVRYLIYRGLRRIVGSRLNLGVACPDDNCLDKIRNSAEPIVIVLAHTGLPFIQSKILDGTHFKRCYQLAADPIGQTRAFQSYGMPQLEAIKFIETGNTCLSVLSKTISSDTIVFCAVDYASVPNQSCDTVSLGIFKFAARMKVRLCFAKLVSTDDGQFVLRLKMASSADGASLNAMLFIEFSLPERMLRLAA